MGGRRLWHLGSPTRHVDTRPQAAELNWAHLRHRLHQQNAKKSRHKTVQADAASAWLCLWVPRPPQPRDALCDIRWGDLHTGQGCLSLGHLTLEFWQQ